MSSQSSAIVIDVGSSQSRIGFAEDESPKAIFPTVTGYSQRDPSEIYFGENVLNNSSDLHIKKPLENGRITDWDGINLFLNHIFVNELNIQPRNHPVLLTESLLVQKSDRETAAEILFETYGVPSVFFGMQPILSLFAAGRMNGFVVDIGDSVANTVPIFDAKLLIENVQHLKIAGKELTNYLTSLIMVKKEPLISNEKTVQDIKHKLCYVSLDPAKEQNVTKTYSLPDGKTLNLGSECFQCPEALFNPALINLDTTGIHDTVYNGIIKTNIDLRRSMYGNILLAGGSTMFEGIADRLKKEVQQLAPSAANVKIIAPQNRQNSAWCGGAVFALMPQFSDMCITKSSYTEGGAAAIHKRFK